MFHLNARYAEQNRILSVLHFVCLSEDRLVTKIVRTTVHILIGNGKRSVLCEAVHAITEF